MSRMTTDAIGAPSPHSGISRHTNETIGFMAVTRISFSRRRNCASKALSLCPQFGKWVLQCSFATALLQSMRPCSRYQQGISSDSDGLGCKPKQLGLLPVLLHTSVRLLRRRRRIAPHVLVVRDHAPCFWLDITASDVAFSDSPRADGPL